LRGRAKPIVVFIFTFGVVYVLLILPWPGLNEAYAKFFRASGELIPGSFVPGGVVELKPFHEAGETIFTTKLILTNRQMLEAAQQTGSMVAIRQSKISSRDFGYLPTALFIALILATPVTRARRGWALLWGLILTNGFIAFKLALEILWQFNENTQLEVMVLSRFWHDALFHVYQFIFLNLETTIVVPVFIWIVVTFRRDDWMMLVAKTGSLKSTSEVRDKTKSGKKKSKVTGTT